MKSVTIEVPRQGASIQLVFPGGASPGQAILVAPDDLEVRYVNPELQNSAVATPPEIHAKSVDNPSLDLAAISASLLKLRTKKRGAAVDVIKTMLQFSNPISTETANQILEDLGRRGYLAITASGAIEFPNQKQKMVGL